MKIKHTTFSYPDATSLVWHGDALIDWVNAGTAFDAEGTQARIGKYHIGFNFDQAIVSDSFAYVLLYERLGTKGLILKKGEIIREINRSYYQSDVYAYPAAFTTLETGQEILIHCPNEYRQIEIEEIETGRRLTESSNRETDDIFHSRLQISPNRAFLLNRGWVWHPYDTVHLYDIAEGLRRPSTLDKSGLQPETGTEINAAVFLDNNRILLGASAEEALDEEAAQRLPPGNIAVWHFQENRLSQPIAAPAKIGNFFPINSHLVWDMYEFPKILDINMGQIIWENRDIYTGKQSSSIIHHVLPLPILCHNHQTNQMAIYKDGKIDILTII